MIGFKTVYDVTTEAEFWVATASFTDEMPNPQGENMYIIDLIPFDGENVPCLYNVPLLIDYSSGIAEYCLPVLEDIINSGAGCYDFDQSTGYELVSMELDGDMINIPLNTTPQQTGRKAIVDKAISNLNTAILSLEKIKAGKRGVL